MKNSRYGQLAFALLLVFSMVLASCTTAATPAAEKPAQEQPAATEQPAAQPAAACGDGEYAVVVKITGIPWFNRMEEGVKKAATELKINAYQTGPAEADPAQQVKVIEDLIAKGVKYIAVVPNDAKALEPVFQKAKEKGVTIITHESPDQVGKDYDLELIDNVKFGQHAWDKMVEFMGDSGDYVVYVGSLTVPLHNLWADEGIKYAADKYPNLKQVTDRQPVGEDQELAHQRTLELLKAYPNLKGIIGFGSLGPPGAAQAVKELGLEEKVFVGGTVLPGPAAPYLKDGSMKWGILWDPADAGYGMVWLANYLCGGGKVTDGMEIPGMGKITLEGDVIKVDGMVDITPENAEGFGF